MSDVPDAAWDEMPISPCHAPPYAGHVDSEQSLTMCNGVNFAIKNRLIDRFWIGILNYFFVISIG
jgi:hypothetical protein